MRKRCRGADGHRGLEGGECRSAVVCIHAHRESGEGERQGVVLAVRDRRLCMRVAVADKGVEA